MLTSFPTRGTWATHPMVAAAGFSLIGLMAIVGTLILGHISDRSGRRKLLAFSYELRGVGFAIVLLSMGVPFLGIPSLGLVPLLIGIMLVGTSWNAVIGITAAFTSDRFGVSHMGTIYGTMFAVMPLGSGLGAYLGGVLYDWRGTYDIAIWSNLALLTASALLVYYIREQRPHHPPVHGRRRLIPSPRPLSQWERGRG